MIRYLPAAAGLLALVFLAVPKAGAATACPQPVAAGKPAVNAQHIFCGEVKKGRASGFHSRPGGDDPATVSGTGTPLPRGPAGIYALIDFQIAEKGRTARKALSTMFPDACDRSAVLAAIRNAARGAVPGKRFKGSSGRFCRAGTPLAPFAIAGFMNEAGVVVTAWPDY